MCSKVQCSKCGKATWSGCGEHIEYALQGVSQEDRCQCLNPEISRTGLFDRLFGN